MCPISGADILIWLVALPSNSPRPRMLRKMILLRSQILTLLAIPLLGWQFQSTADDRENAVSNVDFKADIRPILSNRCFACHGPDEGHVESGLRLDHFESATAPADSGATAIVPGKIDESEMVRRIASTDESERMPPPHFGERLTEREVKLIQAWIASGGVYSKHWSFDKIVPVTLSPVPNSESFPAWQNSPIDLLVKRKLDERGWSPTAPAAPETLLRRLTLDLVGLPPTVEQQKAFAVEPSELAYEQHVDELLASPAFGEHWGRKWLDLARYADSAGYADDPQRMIWAYRDWVVRAINQGMPFDQFTIEQLAGDLLPNPTDDQIVATAFHRNTLTNNEGGTNDEEFRNVAIIDRVNTTMAVWMGLTMGCAQCHSHKFDPISQKEYFQVMAIFNQTEDADRADESPTLKWFTPDQRLDREETQSKLRQVEASLVAPDSNLIQEQEAWSKPFRAPLVWQPVKPDSAKARSNSLFKIQENGDLRVDTISDKDVYSIELPLADNLAAGDLTGLQIRSIPDPALPNGGAAIGDGNFVLTQVSAVVSSKKAVVQEGRFVRIELPGEKKILSLAEVQVFVDSANVAKTGKATQSSTDFEGPAELAIDGKTTGKFTEKSTTHTQSSTSPWWELDLSKSLAIEKIDVWNRTDTNTGERLAGAKISILSEDRRLLWESTIDGPKDTQSFEIRPSRAIPLTAASADFAQEGFPSANVLDTDSKSGWAVGGAIEQPHQLFVAIERAQWLQRWKENPIPGDSSIRLTLKFESATRRASLASFAIAITTDDRAERLAKLPSKIAKLLSTEPSQWTSAELESLHAYYVSSISPSRDKLRSERDALVKKLAEIKPTTTVPILRELVAAKQRSTHIQIRGNYKVHGEQVKANVPSAFHPLKPASPANPENPSQQPTVNRLQFAHWLMQPDNPLTARVLANRYWESFFGTGIVRTSEEFGSQGDLPSNPELLDYLANDLIQSGWDTKRFIKKLVMSAAYRQRSSVSPERYEADPENTYLSRGPRFRVSAEQVRDMALASAGLLSQRMFGPPTQPPQPSLGLKAAFGSKTDWDTSKGEDRFRRGLYTLWRRSNPYPSMATFDAPNREVCVLKRDRTNTPLQALVTLNDPAFVEAAQGLGRRIAIYELPNSSLENRIEHLFRLVLSRSPSPRETDAIINLYRETKQDLEKDPERATKLATDPIGPLPTGADPIELAAWTTLCNVVLNLDEFLMTP